MVAGTFSDDRALAGADDFAGDFRLASTSADVAACAFFVFTERLATAGLAGFAGSGKPAGLVLFVGRVETGLELEVIARGAFPVDLSVGFEVLGCTGLLCAAWAAPDNFDFEVEGCTGVFLGALAMRTFLSEQVRDARTMGGPTVMRAKRGSLVGFALTFRQARHRKESPDCTTHPGHAPCGLRRNQEVEQIGRETAYDP